MKRPQTIVFGILAVVIALAFTACPNSVESPPEPTTGSITGMALFNNGTNHGGIVITLEETDGPRSASVINASRIIATGGRNDEAASVARVTQTNPDGLFTFSDIPPGTYTLHASSQNSLERAVTISVIVRAGEESNAGILNLTHVGSISGQITVDGYGVPGFIVSVAGTSFMAITCDEGLFTISGVPTGEHSLIVARGDFTIFFAEPVEVSGGIDTEVEPKNITGAMLDNTPRVVDGYWWVGDLNLGVQAQGPQGGTPHIGQNGNWWIGDSDLGVSVRGPAGVSIVWQGELAAKPANPQLNWAYFNTNTRNAYIWNGTRWDILAERGEAGTDGNHGLSISWRGTFTEHPANPQQNWAYHNSVAGRSYIFDGIGWQILARDGQNTVFVPVSGVMLSEYNPVSVVIGRSERLEAWVTPSNATIRDMLWSSNRPEIASVDMFTGEVTGHALGSTVITVRTITGNHTATATVRVTPGPTTPGEPSEYAGRLIILHAAGVNTGTGNNAHRTFVELHNRSDATISLDGLSLQWAGGEGYSWNVIPLEGYIPAGHSFLILGTIGDAAARLQIPDADADMLLPNFRLSNRAFRLALMEGTSPLTVHNPSDMSHDGTVDLRTLMPASGASDATVGTERAAGLIDLLGVVNDRAEASDVMHGAKGAPAYRISNQISIRRANLNAPTNNFNDFRGIDWQGRTGAVADDQIPVFSPRNLAALVWTPEFPNPNWPGFTPPPPPPPPPPVGAIAAWNYTVVEAVACASDWPATSGNLTVGTNLEFFYADGARATLGRDAQDRAAVNVPNNAGGWFTASGNHTAANFVAVGIEESAGWVITLNTTGYEDIAFSAHQSSSNNGPRDFRLAYRIGDSGAWMIFNGEGTVTENGDREAGYSMSQTFDNIPLPATVNDQAVVQIRVWIASTAPRGTGNLSATSGNTSLNNIVFTGTAVQ